MPIDGPNYQWPSGVPYIVADRGTMALGVKDVSPFVPDTLTGSENFETDPITGSGTWTLTATTPHAGLRCLRSAVIGNSASTDYTFTVPGGTNFIRFWHRVSSELNFDFFQVYKNVVGVPANLLFQLSGTANIWQQQQISMAGVTSVIFRYIKDSSSAVGLDAAFIDDIEWISTLGAAAVQNYEPFHLNTNNCVKVVLCDNTVAITGTVDVTPLNCAVDSITVCPGDDPLEVIVNNFPAVAHLDCATDSVTICPGDDPIEVTVNNFPVVANLDCTTDSVTICPGEDPIEVTVNNFPANVPLDCETDSVTICPGDDPIVVVATDFDIRPITCATDSIEICPGDDPIVVVATDFDIRPLSCLTDSIEVCNDVGNPVPVSFTRLNCATDSVEICNDAGAPITVSAVDLDIRNLNCATDSVEICNDAGNPITVSATDLDIRNLTCETDSVTICPGDDPIIITGSIENKHPGVPGTIVPGSRWQSHTVGGLGAAPSADSPTPTGSQRVVVDWIHCSAGVAVTLLVVLTSPSFSIVNADGAPGTTYWALSGTIPALSGGLFLLEHTPIILGEVGEELRIRLNAAIAILQCSVAFGGYIVEV